MSIIGVIVVITVLFVLWHVFKLIHTIGDNDDEFSIYNFIVYLVGLGILWVPLLLMR